MTLRAANGAQLHRQVRVKVFLPHNVSSRQIMLRAPAKKGFTDEAVDAQLGHIAKQIEEKFPQHEYRLVALGQARFNFVWEREKQ